MKKGFREIDDSALEAVAGGFVGKDKYSIQEYNKAGVTWEHNVWSKDRYFYKGNKIDQDMAESITAAYQAGMRAKPD